MHKDLVNSINPCISLILVFYKWNYIITSSSLFTWYINKAHQYQDSNYYTLFSDERYVKLSAGTVLNNLRLVSSSKS